MYGGRYGHSYWFRQYTCKQQWSCV
jgi:hypothetical protein